MGRVGGIGCLVPCSGPNLALFGSCGAMDGESCEIGNNEKLLNQCDQQSLCFAKPLKSPVATTGNKPPGGRFGLFDL